MNIEREQCKTPPPAVSTRDKIALRNSWLGVAVVAALTFLLIVKVWDADIGGVLENFEFSDLLTLSLAMFSIGLSVLFYLKATDTSNIFYDNTYRFTRDVSEILGRVEAGFGEKLRHLDEGYSGLKSAVEKLPFDRARAEEEIQEEEAQLQKVERERAELIENLAERARLQEEEKEVLFNRLEAQDAELASARREIRVLRTRMETADRSASALMSQLPPHVRRALQARVVEKMDADLLLKAPPRIVNRRFSAMCRELPSDFLNELRRYYILDEDLDLTSFGIALLKELVQQN